MPRVLPNLQCALITEITVVITEITVESAIIRDSDNKEKGAETSTPRPFPRLFLIPSSAPDKGRGSPHGLHTVDFEGGY